MMANFICVAHLEEQTIVFLQFLDQKTPSNPLASSIYPPLRTSSPTLFLTPSFIVPHALPYHPTLTQHTHLPRTVYIFISSKHRHESSTWNSTFSPNGASHGVVEVMPSILKVKSSPTAVVGSNPAQVTFCFCHIFVILFANLRNIFKMRAWLFGINYHLTMFKVRTRFKVLILLSGKERGGNVNSKTRKNIRM
jgi:hypothetical protein